MNERVEPQKKPPPSPGTYIASLLEISMLAVFAYNRSWTGFIVWLVYFRFSALRALVEENFKN